MKRIVKFKWSLWLLALGFLSGGFAVPEARGQKAPTDVALEKSKLKLPPLPVLSPTALTADAGNGKAFLRWNLQLEDERIIGWKVVQLKPSGTVLTGVLKDPYYVVENLTNGETYTFAVVGVLKNGKDTTPQSNKVSVTPRDVGVATFAYLDRKTTLTIGAFTNITFAPDHWRAPPPPLRVVFPDGQELLYDRCRPIDWKSREGDHLLYPLHFGNGLDIGLFEDSGLPKIIPPQGSNDITNRVTRDPFDADEAGGRVEAPSQTAEHRRRVQRGVPHPYLTTPITMPMIQSHHDAPVVWETPVVDGDRVTLHYAQPLDVMGYSSWTYVNVWETWWPIERDRHGTIYHGLARHIAVELPSVFKDGYQVMLNNGFGPGGTRQGVTSYNSGFRVPAHEVVDYSGDKNLNVTFQWKKPPRRGYMYHPNQDCLQSHPLIFYDWGHGNLTIAARSLYYHCANSSSSYVEQGADGVWPNLAWDIGQAGRRVSVDTVEYLYASNPEQPLPQRYLNSRFEAYHDVSRRMGVQDSLAAISTENTLGHVKGMGGLAEYARKKITELRETRGDTGVDGVYVFHDTWHAVPVTVDDHYRLDENHGVNPNIREMTDLFKKDGFRVGYWFRPEFTKTSLANVLSDRILQAQSYYGYKECQYPEVLDLLKERGIPLVREHPNWIRRRKDGGWPYDTSYQWVPMSMASDWWDRVMWPTIVMSKKLGFDFLLMDGGFGGLQGVDYGPKLDGKTDTAVPCQPYWWRLFRSMEYAGVRLFGECTTGWSGGNVNLTGQGDEHYQWMYHQSILWGSGSLSKEPRNLHHLYQLYNGVPYWHQHGVEHVRRFARDFYTRNKVPDWVELVNLRQLEPTEITISVAESPVAGGGVRISEEDSWTATIRPWAWDDVVWHYDDGTSVTYPAYDAIDWAAK